MRTDLESQLDRLLHRVVDMGERADRMLLDALEALEFGDAAVVDRVREADREVDDAYEHVQHGVLTVVARHGPVARDLRLLTGLVHVSLHVERMGDYAVNVARTAGRARGFPGDTELTRQLLEMGERARDVASAAVRSFAHRDVAAARAMARLDDDVDRLNAAIFRRLVQLAAADDRRLEWATQMMQLARQLERYADHGVDVAEQTIFVVSGEHVELSSNDPR